MSHEPVRAAEVLIVGGGPAGAALGIALGHRGRTVTLIEQSATAHDKVCGEFLSHEAVDYLESLGLAPRALGAVAIHAVRLHGRSAIAECKLPIPALSLTRRTLDEALLARAAGEGVTVHRGKRVEALTRASDGWQARVSGGAVHGGRTAFLATGKHDMNGYRRPAGIQNDLVGFKMYFRLAEEQVKPLNGWVELFLFPGGYAGLQMVESGRANLCLLVTRERLAQCGGEWAALLEHMREASQPLAKRLEGAAPLLAKPLAISSIPFGLLPGKMQDGLWRLGDQAAVIPSFSGDGMSMALHSGLLAAEMYERGASAAEFADAMRAQFRSSVQLATSVSRLMVRAPVLVQAARLWPGLLGHIAARTRVTETSRMTSMPDLRHNGAGLR
ncbi:MAG: FAD-dependent monooxygenase [Terracidiphilus sp.]